MKDSAFVTLLNNNRESYAMWGFVSGANNGYPVLLLSAPVISLTPSGNKTFSPQVVGYGAQTPYSVTINNTGSGETGALTIALSGTNASSFALSASSITTIAAGASSSFTVVPNTGLPEGAYNATVTVSGDAVTTQTFNVGFTVQAATYTVSASPESLAFGSKIEGYAAAPAAQTVTITNGGNSTVTLTTPTNTNYSITALDALTLAPAAAARFDVQPKTGLAVGTYNETITFSTTSGTSDTVTVSFTVLTATYAISASPTSLAFGSAVEGYSVPAVQTVTITNDGNSSVTLSLPTVTDYSLGTLSSSTLASGESATFTVRPKAALGVGSHGATITVSSDHGTSADVSAAFTVQTATYAISASPTSLAFGSAVEGYSAPTAQTVTITNDGNSSVTLSLPTVTDYAMGTLSISTLASGESATFTVRPKAALGVGSHSATITVSSDHGTSADVSAAFTVQTATYAISANPTSLAFGSAVEGYSAPTAQTMTITNDGNSSITLSLPTVTDYTLGTLSTSTLASGESATFTVRPKASLGVGSHSATITVSSDHGTSADVSAAFTVQTATYAISANPTSLAFGSAVEGYSAPTAQTMTITNDGNSSITLSLPTVTDYTLGTLSTSTLASGESATFTVRPKASLGVGSHGATITVSSDHGTSADVSAAFTVQTATYAISANPSVKDFGTIVEGEAPPAAATITVTNSGNMTLTLTQPVATNYTVGTLSSLSIAPSATATFTIAPKSGLITGNYNATIPISGSGGASSSVDVRFTVNEVPKYAISADPASLTFPDLAEGYLLPDVFTVTVTNTGNQNISLYQPTATNYTLGTLSGTTLVPGGAATFTIVPKAGLAVGVWDQTIHIQGSYSVDAQVDVAFTCTTPNVFAILSGDGSTYRRNDPSPPLFIITSEGNIETFTGLTINGVQLDSSNYDQEPGSTIITLHREYLNTLRAGTYTMRFHYRDGYAETRFIVYDPMPLTSDNDMLFIFGALIVLCLIALILVIRKHHDKLTHQMKHHDGGN